MDGDGSYVRAVRAPGFDIDPDRYYESKWIAPAAQFVDPQKEAEAYKSLFSGIMTLSQVIALRGGDFEETMRQRQHELATLMNSALSLTLANEVTKAGQAKVLLTTNSHPVMHEEGEAIDG